MYMHIYTGTDSKNRKIFVLAKGGRSILTLRGTEDEATEWIDKINQHIVYATANKILKSSENSLGRNFWYGGIGSGHHSDADEYGYDYLYVYDLYLTRSVSVLGRRMKSESLSLIKVINNPLPLS
jgi:hypothetical protein